MKMRQGSSEGGRGEGGRGRGGVDRLKNRNVHVRSRRSVRRQRRWIVMGCCGRGCEWDPSHSVLEETKRGLDLLRLSYSLPKTQHSFLAYWEQVSTDRRYAESLECWKSLTLLGKLSLSPARAAHPFLVRTKTSDMRLESMQRRKQYDHEKVGCAVAMESGGSLRNMPFLLLAQESGQGKGGHTLKRKDVSEDSTGLYILLPLPLIS